jgi:glucose/arabinose dehydrogenase
VHRVQTHRFAAAVLIALCALSSQRLTSAQTPAGTYDESPLNVEIVPAWPNLEWPDFITGADEGRFDEPRPIIIMGAGDGTNRMFVATQPGTILVFPNDPEVAELETFLDLREKIHYRVPQENEEGFLGLAFHPKFKDNGEFFVYYTGEYDNERDRRSVISRFRVSQDDPNRADPASEEVLMVIPDKYWNHNGATLLFGPDGYMYIGLGDGGMGGDPDRNGQNLGELWGKILRIDVDNKDPGLEYAIPKDNPFVGKEGARGEVWAYGIRNIWRMAFDRATGVLWAADVGQDIWEEIDLIVKGGNYGWNLREGFHPFKNGSDARPDLIEPIHEYHHDVGKSITGGNVYRGKQVPELEGGYLYADFVSGRLWALWYDMDAKKVTANRLIAENAGAVITFGEDDAGETYFGLQNGDMFKFASPETAASN